MKPTRDDPPAIQVLGEKEVILAAEGGLKGKDDASNPLPRPDAKWWPGLVTAKARLTADAEAQFTAVEKHGRADEADRLAGGTRRAVEEMEHAWQALRAPTTPLNPVPAPPTKKGPPSHMHLIMGQMKVRYDENRLPEKIEATWQMLHEWDVGRLAAEGCEKPKQAALKITTIRNVLRPAFYDLREGRPLRALEDYYRLMHTR